MSIGSVSEAGASPSTALQVKLVKGQQNQEASVTSTIIKSATQTASLTGKGGVLNVLA
jgi:hypothetical protein